jgi:hypothetical protein
MPVTVEEFAEFICRGQYHNEKNWDVLAGPRPGADEVLARIEYRLATSKRRVVAVTWFEADAYCFWLGGCLPSAHRLRDRQPGWREQAPPAEWASTYYYPGRIDDCVKPQPPLRMRVEAWKGGECLPPTAFHRDIGFTFCQCAKRRR